MGDAAEKPRPEPDPLSPEAGDGRGRSRTKTLSYKEEQMTRHLGKDSPERY